MRITADVFSEESPAPVSEVLAGASLTQLRREAARLLREHRKATRVEVRLDGGLMFTFLAPPDGRPN